MGSHVVLVYRVTLWCGTCGLLCSLLEGCEKVFIQLISLSPAY